jgi:hypothetical protein
MKISIRVIERRARVGMSIISAVLVLGLIAFQAGLITPQTSYQPDRWYQASDHGGYVVLREFSDESLCRKEEDPAVGCRSGKSLTEKARADAASQNLK